MVNDKKIAGPLDFPVTTINGVGPKGAEVLVQQGIETIEDLFFNVPKSYDDFSNVTQINDVVSGQITIKGTLSAITGRYVRRGLHITQATVSDETGSLNVVWFNQPYRAKQLKEGVYYYCSGSFEFSNRRYVLLNPSTEQVSDEQRSTARIVPKYRESKGLSSAQIRKMIFTARQHIRHVQDTLPQIIIDEQQLMPLADALEYIHFPPSMEELQRARHRLGFDEVFELSLAAQLNKADLAVFSARDIPFDATVAATFTKGLKFALTAAQKRAAWDILQDMTHTTPMNRLLEGDVGSGKTVVAGMAVRMAAAAGVQVAIMAPTGTLAQQHLVSFKEMLGPDITVELLISASKKDKKEHVKKRLAEGKLDVVIGTHALLQSDVSFKHIGLVIIDEQHRFGVEQRQRLMSHGLNMPHMLSMTATPIPRTLTLTLYGEMDVSVIDELPPGRLPVITEIHSPNSIKQLYQSIDTQIAMGRQAFIICPLIDESDTLGFKSVEAEYKRLRSTIFKHRRIGMLHGRLSSDEKEHIMMEFTQGRLDILLATTVIEVGVNVPNATIMLVDGADRFGLAQLHQLRGRVGRAAYQSYCYLVPSTSKQPSIRLKHMAATTDGFKLAELDLELRGPGEIYGKRQHGALDLRIARLSDITLIMNAQKAAKRFIESDKTLLQYPRLAKRVMRLRAITKLN